MEGDVISLQDIFVFDFRAGLDEFGRYRGTLQPTGLRPQFLDRLAEIGVERAAETFRRIVSPFAATGTDPMAPTTPRPDRPAPGRRAGWAVCMSATRRCDGSSCLTWVPYVARYGRAVPVRGCGRAVLALAWPRIRRRTAGSSRSSTSDPAGRRRRRGAAAGGEAVVSTGGRSPGPRWRPALGGRLGRPGGADRAAPRAGRHADCARTSGCWSGHGITVGAGCPAHHRRWLVGRPGRPDRRLAAHHGSTSPCGSTGGRGVRRAAARRAAAGDRLAAVGLLAAAGARRAGARVARPGRRPSSVGRWPSTGSARTSPTRWSGVAQRTQQRGPRLGGHGGPDPARGRRQPGRGAADHGGHDARAGPAAPACARAVGRGPAVGVGPDRACRSLLAVFMFIYRRRRTCVRSSPTRSASRCCVGGSVLSGRRHLLDDPRDQGGGLTWIC